jgi:acetyl-CoA carboxylase biotin carboxylase subunit
VNTRVQVEHPVTEQVTGIDIVKEMIRIAAGEPLSCRQKDVSLTGHAIECRINAEDPQRGFLPQPGRVDTFVLPGGPGVRIDTHVRPGYTIPPHYDSMIGKLIVHGPTREEAIARMKGALGEFIVSPIKTTIPMHRRIMDTRQFRTADFDIHYIERLLADGTELADVSAAAV